MRAVGRNNVPHCELTCEAHFPSAMRTRYFTCYRVAHARDFAAAFVAGKLIVGAAGIKARSDKSVG
jgi:hypothetical protein